MRRLVLLFSIPLFGCDRDCAGHRLEGAATPERQLGEATRPLREADCVSGMARCESGERVISVGGVPRREGGCEHRSAGRCANGCAAEGVEIALSEADEDGDSLRLCAGSERFELAAAVELSGDLAPCEEGDTFACAASHVVRCPRTVIATCHKGCGTGALGDDAAALKNSAAAALLCAHM